MRRMMQLDRQAPIWIGALCMLAAWCILSPGTAGLTPDELELPVEQQALIGAPR